MFRQTFPGIFYHSVKQYSGYNHAKSTRQTGLLPHCLHTHMNLFRTHHMHTSLLSSILRLAAVFAALSAPQVMAAATPEDAQTDRIADAVIRSVRNAIAGGNCDAAVYHLKDGLKSKRPKVALLAGSMYEQGLCVKRDWDSAVSYYALAADGGLDEGADRLAAGYADPANGPDIAAALWWAQQRRVGRLELSYCAIGTEAAQDPDRFVAELGKWEPERLAICNYVLGVSSMLQAELAYPELAAEFGLGAEIRYIFHPGKPAVELQQSETQEYAMLGVIDGDALRYRNRKDKTGGFEKTLNDVARRALARYPQPPGIPADAKVYLGTTFFISHR